MHTQFWLGSLEGRDHLEDLGVDGRCTHGSDGKTHKVFLAKPKVKRPLGRSLCMWEDNIKIYLKSYGDSLRTGFVWLRIDTSGEVL
jgi:hypothetical protein